MSVLLRGDLTPFVLRPYRETIQMSGHSLFKKEIRLLSENYGNYARFFKQPDGSYEGVFSHDAGYLLGDLIWQHFAKPDNLIYCEELPEAGYTLMVIVIDGKVFLDNKINHRDLLEELATLSATPLSFSVYVCGDTPLSDHPGAGKLVLDTERVNSFSRLTEALFPTLALDPHLQLLPIETAISELKIDQPLRIFIALMFGLVLLTLIGWWVEELPTTATLKPVQVELPAQHYLDAMQTPDPANQLRYLANAIVLLYSLPGWQAVTVTYDNGNLASVEVHSLGGSLDNLLKWAAANRITVELNRDGATMYLTLPMFNRSNVDKVPLNTQATLAVLVDRMMQVIPQKSVTINGETALGYFKKTDVTVEIKNLSPAALKLVAGQLSGLPIVLTSSTLNLTNGLLSGTIQLTVLGN